jgi:tetratricopeptide (TPR) repeat protein
VDLAYAVQLDQHVCRLVRAIWSYHWNRGNAAILVHTTAIALIAAGRLGDRGATAWAHRHLAGAYFRCGDMPSSRAHLQQALALYRANGNTAAELAAMVNLMAVEAITGDVRAAMSVGAEVLQRETGLSDKDRHEFCAAGHESAVHRIIGECRTLQGDHLGALRSLRLALAALNAPHSTALSAHVLCALGRVHARLGHLLVAPLLLRRAATLYERAGREIGVGEALAELGTIRAEEGRLDEALRLQEDALARMSRSGNPHGQCIVLNHLARTLLISGDTNRAQELAQDALRIAGGADFPHEMTRSREILAAALKARRSCDRGAQCIGGHHRSAPVGPVHQRPGR